VGGTGRAGFGLAVRWAAAGPGGGSEPPVPPQRRGRAVRGSV